ncbi:hypothetical protein MACH17_16800 [Phaeobacter inhibens]|nr:hypothetical protein MACH17_16800 [Phaeobacter inhibens]
MIRCHAALTPPGVAAVRVEGGSALAQAVSVLTFRAAQRLCGYACGLILRVDGRKINGLPDHIC